MEQLNDVLGYDNLKIFQDSHYFSFSLDSIVLANYATIRLRDKKIVDFCTGNGIVPLILSRRCNVPITGVEILFSLSELAKKSVYYNHLENRIEIVCSSVQDFSKNHLNEFDLILCNPPYFKVNEKNFFNESYEKMVARHEVFITLEEICDCAKKILKDHGNICLVHRSERLMDILEMFRKYNIEPKRIKFIYETVGKDSTLVLVEGQKCGNVGLIVDKPLIQYDSFGNFTKEYEMLQKEVRK